VRRLVVDVFTTTPAFAAADLDEEGAWPVVCGASEEAVSGPPRDFGLEGAAAFASEGSRIGHALGRKLAWLWGWFHPRCACIRLPLRFPNTVNTMLRA
jgi:hypothetical protein